MTDAIKTQSGGYKKTVENLKLWFCSGGEIFKKKLIISWSACQPEDYEKDKVITDWASQFISLHKEGVSEFKVNIRANMINFDSLRCFQSFFEMGVVNTFPLRITLDDVGVDCLARLNNSTGVRNLMIMFASTSNTNTGTSCPSFLLSNCHVKSLLLTDSIFGDIDLRKMTSLKQLSYFACKINCKVVNNLPDTLTELYLSTE
ncbi:unnamed protein product [Ambrosiozyma monospora]|uniref:Unnamed protein product n=1 Tax=Ambrosiozyma monospora TaxID=43982 RepID=A0ACB5U6D6_AMBMO|nr:unnamed protein product [Ambrosiozyma monospora]